MPWIRRECYPRDQDDIQVLFMNARLAADQGEPSEALELLREIPEDHPELHCFCRTEGATAHGSDCVSRVGAGWVDGIQNCR